MFRKSLMLISFLTLALFVGCKGKGAPGAGAGFTPIVTVAPVSSQEVKYSESFVGHVDAVHKASISARVNGFLSSKLVKEGDLVVKNQPLFIIEPYSYKAAVDQAKAVLMQAEATANNAKLQKDRAAALLKSGGIAKAKYDDINASYMSATATVAAAEASLNIAKLNLSYTTVTAPISGRIGYVNFNVGETVGPASGPLTSIIAQDPMYVNFSVTEKQLQALKHMYGVKSNNVADFDNVTNLFIVMSDGTQYAYQGKIDFIDTSFNSVTDSLKLRGVFSNPDNALAQGQSVNINMVATTPTKEIVIPDSAILSDLSGKYVLVATYTDKKDGSATISNRYLTLGPTIDNTNRIVLANLKEGEFIVVDGIQKTRAGQEVKALTKEQYEKVISQQNKGE